ncbi:MAG: O-acetyl-ADP-ribose deacetylase [Fidelibacterota bacterium]
MNPFKNIEILQIDITTLKVDAIVNAANSGLMGGGGVDGAIHRAAGPELLKVCKKLRKTELPDGLPTGEAVLTEGYNLPAKYVIHTVGPVWRNGIHGEEKLLASCYKNSLNIALEKEMKSIAFPAISTGVYGYPKDKAVKVVIPTVLDWLKKNSSEIKIKFSLINDNYNIYREYLEKLQS